MEKEVMEIQKTVELDAKDRCNAMIYNIFFRRKWVTCYVGIFILFSLAVLITGFANIFNVPQLLMLSAGAFLLLLVGFIITMFASSKGAVTSRKLTFNDMGITTSTGRDNKSVSFKWKDLFFMGKTRNYFYYYLDASQFIIVPKRFFEPHEIEVLKKYF